MQLSMKESYVLAACLQYLQFHRIFAWRQNQGGIPLANGRFRRFNGMPGQSDIIGCLPDGRFLACEVKRPGGKMTTEQEDFHQRVSEAGGVAMCVSSLDELEGALRRAGVL
jgi:hypothetical protein